MAQKQVTVVGLDSYGLAAIELLAREGATVHAVDPGSPARSSLAESVLDRWRIRASHGEATVAADLAVVSPAVSGALPVVEGLRSRRVPVISELELGYRHSLCLTVAVGGSNGKSSTVSMLARVLERGQRRVAVAGGADAPLCGLVDRTRDLDFVLVEASPPQLAGADHFRPAVAVFLNLAPTLPPRYLDRAELARSAARVFANQQCFDWAIVQSEALAELRVLGVEPPSKVITFSERNRRADIWFDRGLLQGRLPDWTGPLLDMARCRARGPHQAENLMAALAVGHVLRIPLETMVEGLLDFEPGPGCGEVASRQGGVVYLNDARAANPEALRQSLRSAATSGGLEPNVWLIAGGVDEGYEYHDLGPLLSRHVKRAFLLGEAANRMRAAWSLFTPCTVVSSLLEAVQNAVDMAEQGDVVLFSPACSCSDELPSPQLRGEAFRDAVRRYAGALLPKPARSVSRGATPAARSEAPAEADDCAIISKRTNNHQEPN